jgi:acetyl-CoA C-acetyltransferase
MARRAAAQYALAVSRIAAAAGGSMNEARITGWSHTPFGRLDHLDLEALVGQACRDALRHARIDAADIDAVFVGHAGMGMVRENFVSSYPMQAEPGLRFKPATRVENACATGTAAVYQAIAAIESGRARAVLVVGAEKMTAAPGPQVTAALADASYVREESAEGLTFPGIFARFAQAYFERHGDHGATLARIAAKNHANGARNPYAHMRRDLGFDFCNTVSDRNPIVAAPLRKTDCSLVSDGAAALVLVRAADAAGAPRAIRFRATVQVSDFLPLSRRDPLAFEGPRRAWRQALDAAGLEVRDLDFAEVHDCFTVAELMTYEAMGLAAPGEGARLLEDGTVYPGGALPVNPSGGLKAKGHPIGATGVSMHAIACMQLTGEAGDFQVPGARLGAVFNMGGSAVVNCVSILEAAP